MKTIDSNEERIKQLEENIEMRQKMYDREIQKEKSVIPTSLAGGLFGFIFVKMFTETFVWWLSGLGAIVAFSWAYKVSSEANTRARNIHLSEIDYLRDKINIIKKYS